MAKLTLSVDAHVVERAKRYTQQRGTSVSQLVETLLDLVASNARHGRGAPTPVLRALRGSMRKGSLADYRRHLEDKYK